MPFYAEYIYRSMIDPFPRTRQQRIAYGKGAFKVYIKGDTQSVKDVFNEKVFIGQRNILSPCPRKSLVL